MNIPNRLFPIPEIEDIIFDYLDSICNLASVVKVNHYYYGIITQRNIYICLRNYVNKYGHSTNNFEKACRHGQLNAAKYFLRHNRGIDIHSCLKESCLNGHLDVAEWLQQLGGTIAHNYMFLSCCDHGHLNIVNWLHQTHIFDIHYDAIFELACWKNHLDIAIWLYNVADQIDINVIDDYDGSNILQSAISMDHRDIIIWLCNLDEISTYNFNMCFYDCVSDDRLEMVIFLLESFHHLIKMETDDNSFIGISNDNLATMIWFYNYERIDTHPEIIHEAFKFSCEMDWSYGALWLYNLDITILSRYLSEPL